MTSYRFFLGIDIGKKSFFVNKYSSKRVDEFDNTPEGIQAFIAKYKNTLHKPNSQVHASINF